MSSLSNAIYFINKVVEHQADGLTFTDLIRDSGIPQGSAHRTLKELTSLRVLAYDPDRKTYRGSMLLASIGAQILEKYDIRENTRQALKALHSELGHVVTLGVREGLSGIYVDKIESRDFGLRLHSEIGKSFPLHCTAIGKILLAHADAETQDKFFGMDLTSFTPNTLTDRVALQASFADIIAQGYAVDDEEITRGLVCIAAPVFKIREQIAGGMSFTCPKHIWDTANQSHMIDTVILHAQKASGF